MAIYIVSVMMRQMREKQRHQFHSILTILGLKNNLLPGTRQQNEISAKTKNGCQIQISKANKKKGEGTNKYIQPQM